MHVTTILFGVALGAMILFAESAAARQEAAPASRPSGAVGEGTLIVLNKAEASVSLLDRMTGESIATIGVGVGPHEVAVSPDGKTAVVCNYGQRTPGNTLSVIDLPSQRVTRTIDLGEHRRPHGIMYFRDGHRLAVTTEASKKLLVVDVAAPVGMEILHAIDTKAEISHMVVLSPDETRAFVANLGSSSITAIDLVSMRHLKVIPTGRGAEAMDISPDGREVWVGNRDANNITIVDAQSLEVVHEMPCPRFPIRCKFTPDGKHVLVSNASSGDVAIFDVKRRTEIKRLPMNLEAVEGHEERLFSDRFGNSPVPVGILIPPDGRQAYVANTNADIVTVINLESMEIVDRLTGGKEPDGLGWTKLELAGGR